MSAAQTGPGTMTIDLLTGDRVICVARNVSLRDVATVMINEGIGAVVVGTQSRPVGIVTEHDVLYAVAEGLDLLETTAGDVAHTRLIWTDDTATVAEVAAEMMEHYVRHVLVERSGRLRGIVSARDLLGVYASADAPSNE